MMTLTISLTFRPEAFDAMRARLARHLYGKAKALPLGLPQRRPDVLVVCEDCAWLAQDGDGPCATHRRACEGCGVGGRPRYEGAAKLHDGEISRTKFGPEESPIVERWCDHCDPPEPAGAS